MTEDSKPQFWYNTQTDQVEEGAQSLAIYRIGPFETAEEAARAPEIVKERAEAWAEEDRDEDR